MTANLQSHLHWYLNGRLSPYVRAYKVAGAAVSMVEASQPAGDMSDPANSDLVIVQSFTDGAPIRFDFGAGRVRTRMARSRLGLVSPGVVTDVTVDAPHIARVFALPSDRYRPALEAARRAPDPFDFGRLHSTDFAAPRVLRLLDLLWCGTASGAASQLLAEGLAFQLLSELTRLSEGGGSPAKSGLSAWAERRCTEMMRERLAEDISLADLAREARLSPFHFARMFKQSVGIAPHTYLVQLRIEKACELLTTTDLSVTEIAQAVGYSSSQALNRAFAKVLGLSPMRYRQDRRL